MMNNKGFELSINMLVVIILGIAMLGVGMSLFSSAFSKTQDLRDDVNSQTQLQLNALLDDGSIIVIPQKTLEGERGELAEFSLGITNIHPEPTTFIVHITYGGSSAFPDHANALCPSPDPDCDPFNPFDFAEKGTFRESCATFGSNDPDDCGDAWVVLMPGFEEFELDPNERKFMPIGINVPKSKNIKGGQYIFNVDVCIGVHCVPEGFT